MVGCTEAPGTPRSSNPNSNAGEDSRIARIPPPSHARSRIALDAPIAAVARQTNQGDPRQRPPQILEAICSSRAIRASVGVGGEQVAELGAHSETINPPGSGCRGPCVPPSRDAAVAVNPPRRYAGAQLLHGYPPARDAGAPAFLAGWVIHKWLNALRTWPDG